MVVVYSTIFQSKHSFGEVRHSTSISCLSMPTQMHQFLTDSRQNTRLLKIKPELWQQTKSGVLTNTSLKIKSKKWLRVFQQLEILQMLLFQLMSLNSLLSELLNNSQFNKDYFQKVLLRELTFQILESETHFNLKKQIKTISK